MLFLGNLIYSQEIAKTFKQKDKIEIKLVSGNCFVSKSSSNEIKIRIVYTYSKEDYEPEFEEGSSTLRISEKFLSNHSSGKSKWYVETPERTDIEFSSASGNLKVENLTGNLDAHTASGDVEVNNLGGKLEAKTASGKIDLNNINGEVKAHTASGDIKAKGLMKKSSLSTASGGITAIGCKEEIKASTASGEIEAENLEKKVELSAASGHINLKNAKGEFKLSCASGDVKAEGITIDGASKFATASGSVFVKLAKSAEFDIKLASASGDVKLDYNGNPVIGYFEFTADAEHGSISSPIKFDKEEKYYEHDREIMKKSFTKGKDKPVIKIGTASGEAALKE
jgi:hypothetical protein